MTSLTLSVEHRQQQGLSPRLQRAVRLLQMSSTEFAQEVYDCVGKNPFLDIDEGEDGAPDAAQADGADDLGGSLAETGAAPAQSLTDPVVTQIEDLGTSDHDADSDHDGWKMDDRMPGASRGEEGTASALDMHAEESSLVDHLLSQLRVMPLSTRDRVIAETVVGSLDEDGYLRVPLEELMSVTGLATPPAEEEMRIALSRVQSLDPAGVGARDVRECLLLQVPEIACAETRERARVLVKDHLQMLAANDLNGMARALSCTPAEVQPVIEAIRRLAPRPGWRFGGQDVQYVVPDVIVRKQRGQWICTLNPAVVPKVRLHHVYIELFQRNRKASQHSELAAQLHEANWTVNNIEQRFATILGIAEAIIRRQRHFLEFGPLAMKPLGLREIADEVGVHESTVSRVTNNKYMATPQGVFELKYFFSRALATASGGECSATAIRSLIHELITAERPSAPLSDAEVARQLARQGIVVARRTVTKYRQALRIESFERRRKLA